MLGAPVPRSADGDAAPAARGVCDDRFAREYGPWRPVMAQVIDKFLARGVLENEMVWRRMRDVNMGPDECDRNAER